MSLILKQEGQRWLHSFYLKKKKKRNMRFGRHQCDTKFSQRAFFPPTFRLASVFDQVFVWDGEVASL